jgi:hypothetical protein
VNQLEQAYFEIGRTYVHSLEFAEQVHQYLDILEYAEFAEVLDFAAAKKQTKKPTCNAGKSHLCSGLDNIGGSCVPTSKQCVSSVVGAAKTAADYIVKKITTGTSARAYEDRYSDAAVAAKPIREKKFEAVAKRLENGRFKPKAGDSDLVAMGKNTAIEAVRDAKNPAVALLTAKNANNEEIGFLSLKTGRKNLEIVHIGTDQSEKGTGRELFERAVQMANSAGRGMIVSATDDAIGFYKKMGMNDMGSGSDFSLSASEIKAMSEKIRQKSS